MKKNRQTALLFLLFIFLFTSCAEDIDITVPRNLQEYMNLHTSRTLDGVIAYAASDKTLTSTSHIFYYPIEEATDVRYYETDSINTIDPNNFSLYRRKILPKEDVFGGYLKKFIRLNNKKEKWCLITYLSEGKFHKSKPIRFKNFTKPTEWKDTVRIEDLHTLNPKFSWDDGTIAENDTYFQVVSDVDDVFLSGTYTTTKWFQYYKLDNVVSNITTKTPPTLIFHDVYHFTLMGISNDNWINLMLEKPFIVD